jgi:hypothetical protein
MKVPFETRQGSLISWQGLRRRSLLSFRRAIGE